MMRCGRWSARSMIIALVLAVSLACGAQPAGGPVTSAPPELGMAIDDYLAHGAVNLRNIRAVLVSQRGELLAERYYHSDAAAYAEIHSATKSVISTLVGIALTKGDLESVDQTLGELLPQHRSAMSKRSAGTTVRQLLTMTGGWTAFYNAETASPKLVRRALVEGPEVDPGIFVYSNVGPHLLSAVLVQATGMSTLAYARRELFDPLGIKSQPAFEGPIAQRDKPTVVSTNSFRWLRDPDGVHGGSYGLALTARDMVKIGELWLNGGVWHGRRILDADYITQASSNRVPEFGVPGLS